MPARPPQKVVVPPKPAAPAEVWDASPASPGCPTVKRVSFQVYGRQPERTSSYQGHDLNVEWQPLYAHETQGLQALVRLAVLRARLLKRDVLGTLRQRSIQECYQGAQCQVKITDYERSPGPTMMRNHLDV